GLWETIKNFGKTFTLNILDYTK
uniref:Brevinin-2LTa n=1 Tax=Rana latastei TaxID=151453 RepID=BR2A_RANLT|nr:RecName: Full=Brevinin-2LTa [Rana latastei]